MKFSLLVPTFHRPAKLARLLNHLVLQIDKSLFDWLDLELIIADGYVDTELDVFKNAEVKVCLKKLEKYCKVKVFQHPGASLSERLYKLAENASGQFVMLLGDDDLIILENCRKLLDQFSDVQTTSTISGRLVNVTGLSPRGLRCDVSERPYVGYSLDHSSPIVRIAQYFSLNAVGTNALAYSIQSRNLFLRYTELINQDRFFYGGLEMIHQVMSLISGPVFVSEIPLIFRDFTYLDYKIESLREAPSTDPYPYHGSEAVRLITKLIFNSTNLSQRESLAFIESILKQSKDLQSTRMRVRDAQFYPLSVDVESKYLSSANYVWRMHLNSVYSKRSVRHLRIMQLPGYLALRKLLSYFKRTFRASV